MGGGAFRSHMKAYINPRLEYVIFPTPYPIFGPGARFSKVPYLFGLEKLFYVCRVCIQDHSFINFENDAMKLSFREAKLTDL